MKEKHKCRYCDKEFEAERRHRVGTDQFKKHCSVECARKSRRLFLMTGRFSK